MDLLFAIKNGYAATGLGGATNKNENHPADRVMVPISAV